MDEAITCVCGNQFWVIGTSGTRCATCNRFLDKGLVEADISIVNKILRVAKGANEKYKDRDRREEDQSRPLQEGTF